MLNDTVRMENQDCDVSGAACTVDCPANNSTSARSRIRSTSLPLISSVNSLDVSMMSPLLHDEDESESVISSIPSPKSSSSSPSNFIAENPSQSPFNSTTHAIPPSSPNQRLRLLCEKYNSSAHQNNRSNSCIPNQPCSLKTLLMDDLQSSRSNSSLSGNISHAKHCPFHRHSTSDLFCVSRTKMSDAYFHSNIGKPSSSSSPMDDMENSSGCTESEMAHMFFFFVLGIVMVIVQFAKKCFKDDVRSQTISQTSSSSYKTPIIVGEPSSSTTTSSSIR